MASNTGIVKLNIGGTVFQTTKSTLTRFDGFFKTMLETEVPVTQDESGAIFIDRDSTHFRLILNFMRDGDVKLPASEENIEEIFKEAQYYLLDGLVELCTKPIHQPDSTIFRMLNSEVEEHFAVFNSKKPVVIFSSGSYLYELFCHNEHADYEEFIRRNSKNWNVYFKVDEKCVWTIYTNKKHEFRCDNFYGNRYSCGFETPYYEFLKHIEHHMNQYLTNPSDIEDTPSY